MTPSPLIPAKAGIQSPAEHFADVTEFYREAKRRRHGGLTTLIGNPTTRIGSPHPLTSCAESTEHGAVAGSRPNPDEARFLPPPCGEGPPRSGGGGGHATLPLLPEAAGSPGTGCLTAVLIVTIVVTTSLLIARVLL